MASSLASCEVRRREVHAGGGLHDLRLAAAAGIGVGLVGIAASLLWVLSQIGPGRRRWAIVAFVVQVRLTAVGLLLYAIEAAYQPGTPQHPGTDGPFADGANGALALVTEKRQDPRSARAAGQADPGPEDRAR